MEEGLRVVGTKRGAAILASRVDEDPKKPHPCHVTECSLPLYHSPPMDQIPKRSVIEWRNSWLRHAHYAEKHACQASTALTFLRHSSRVAFTASFAGLSLASVG